MELFHGSKSHKKPDGVLTHFGSMLAACQRVESIFATKERRVYAGGSELAVIDYRGRIKRIEDFEETLASFADHAGNTFVSKFDIRVSNSLRLDDCWDDDPIGSGGMEIFKTNDQLSQKQREELKAVFSPFAGIVYPQHVYSMLSTDEIRKITKAGQKNYIFKREYEKREERSRSIGEDFKIAAAHEAVWVDLTLRLRNWAMANEFDGLVYSSAHEADGAECCVTLRHNQVLDPLENYEFDRQKYMDMVGPGFRDYFKAQWEEGRRTSPGGSSSTDAYWGGFNPLIFWNPS